jgi:hypothetical protein
MDSTLMVHLLLLRTWLLLSGKHHPLHAKKHEPAPTDRLSTQLACRGRVPKHRLCGPIIWLVAHTLDPWILRFT